MFNLFLRIEVSHSGDYEELSSGMWRNGEL